MLIYAESIRPVRIINPDNFKPTHNIIAWDLGAESPSEYKWYPSKRLADNYNQESTFTESRPLQIQAPRRQEKDILTWTTECTRGELQHKVYSGVDKETSKLNIITWDDPVDKREEGFYPTRKYNTNKQISEGAEVAVILGRKDLEKYCEPLPIPRRIPGQILPNDESTSKPPRVRPGYKPEKTWYHELVEQAEKST